MERWIGKVAVVTGASSGIGEGISVCLVQHGLKVVGLARRLERMEKIRDNLKDAKGTFYPKRCDLTCQRDILEAFEFANTLGGVDVLVNNAGVAFKESIIDGTTEKYKNVMDVNVIAAVICTREATKSMRQRNVEGHIININSVLGHNINKSTSSLSLYQASKYAITAISEVVRNELAISKAPIKVTSLSPGLVKTDMPVIKESFPEKIFSTFPHLQVQDVADAVLYVLGTPSNVQVTELTITALNEGSFTID